MDRADQRSTERQDLVTHDSAVSADVANPGPPRLSPRVVALLYWVSMTFSAGTQALYSFLPVVGREIGIPDRFVAMAGSVAAVLWFFCAPIWSSASDRIGRKPIIVIGCIGFVVGILASAVSVLAGMKGWISAGMCMAGIMASRCMFGGFALAANPASQAYIADHTDAQSRTRTLSLMSSGQGLGAILGPAVAPLLLLPFLGVSGPIFVFTGIGIATLIAVLFVVPHASPARAVKRAPTSIWQKLGLKGGFWTDPQVGPFVWFALLIGAVGVINSQVIGFMIIDLTGLPPVRAQPLAAMVMMSGALATLGAQSMLIPLLRLRPNQLLWAGVAFELIGNGLLLAARNVPVAGVGFALACLGLAFARPGFTAGASLAVSRDRQGEIAGSIASASIVGLIFAPVIVVGFYEKWRPAPYAINLVLLVLILGFLAATPALRRAGEYGASDNSR